MAFILTFLGKGGVGKTTLAIAAAKQFATQNKRVLLATQDNSPAFGITLGQVVGHTPQNIAANLDTVQFHSATLLEKGWEEVKQLEAQYVRTPFFKNVYGQELGLLPGMESALVMNEIRRYDKQYDVIVFDSLGNQETLRMIGMPEVISWYVRRFRQVFVDSDLGKTVAPFLPPIGAAVLNVNWTADNFAQPTQEINTLLNQGKQILADPNRSAAYLVTTDDPAAIATAQYLWGSAQQVGLTVGGVLSNQANISDGFAPLSISTIPRKSGDDWEAMINALPDFTQATTAPKPIVIDTSNRQVSLFLPSFNKQQVKLTQYGPEVTIEAGDQRRNIFLPPELNGRPVSGAKFQDSHLIISFQ
ncbi:ArsA family ATPase [filamentous cyanobacterium LEGE 11480]|uniref:ArsA family ATPase n=1 Tax=Romeriopsis navalis LEGE 11480 TaxID=2777977 RepID=A0A928VMZ0_9CYAN|nr:ArsA family ATPase [Romeriopsis navalis]MBE9029651.1 ArsA family ATPase [Romeriopsis navalis LEGE 11480]